MTIRQWLVTLALAGFLLTFPVGLVLPLFVGPTHWAGVLFGGGLLSLLVGFVLAGGVPKNTRTRERVAARRRYADATWQDGYHYGVGPYADSGSITKTQWND